MKLQTKNNVKAQLESVKLNWLQNVTVHWKRHLKETWRYHGL